MFGSGYVIDHCVSAFSEKQKLDNFMYYVTDALKVIGHLNMRFYDVVNPVEETRSADEIKESIKEKLRRIGNESVRSDDQNND